LFQGSAHILLVCCHVIPVWRRTRSDGTVTVSSLVAPNAVSQFLSVRQETERGWLVGGDSSHPFSPSPLPELLFRRSSPRRFGSQSRFGENYAPRQQHAKTCKKAKMPDFTAIVTPIYNCPLRREQQLTIRSALVPCHYYYGQVTARRRNCTMGFLSQCARFVPQKNLRGFFSILFFFFFSIH